MKVAVVEGQFLILIYNTDLNFGTKTVHRSIYIYKAIEVQMEKTSSLQMMETGEH